MPFTTSPMAYNSSSCNTVALTCKALQRNTSDSHLSALKLWVTKVQREIKEAETISGLKPVVLKVRFSIHRHGSPESHCRQPNTLWFNAKQSHLITMDLGGRCSCCGDGTRQHIQGNHTAASSPSLNQDPYPSFPLNEISFTLLAIKLYFASFDGKESRSTVLQSSKKYKWKEIQLLLFVKHLRMQKLQRQRLVLLNLCAFYSTELNLIINAYVFFPP